MSATARHNVVEQASAFTFPLKSIPALAGHVTFKTEISYNQWLAAAS
jgi:hypothetical protein